MKTATVIAAALVAASFTPALSQSAEPTTVVSGGDTTIVYVFPTSPQSFVPVAGLPSFLVMPGAQIPAVATEVVYTVPQPTVATTTVATASTVADLDCANFIGIVTISGPDRFGLDKDGDGIGCEPEDR
jgi:hypothetical protein